MPQALSMRDDRRGRKRVLDMSNREAEPPFHISQPAWRLRRIGLGMQIGPQNRTD